MGLDSEIDLAWPLSFRLVFVICLFGTVLSYNVVPPYPPLFPQTRRETLLSMYAKIADGKRLDDLITLFLGSQEHPALRFVTPCCMPVTLPHRGDVRGVIPV